MSIIAVGAGRGTWTLTDRCPTDFKSVAYAYSAIPAYLS